LGRGPLDVALACDMTLGVSGGPWLQHVRRGIGTVIAVQSAIAAPYPWTYGALLDGTDKQLFTSLDRRAVPII
jgi:hypothetical protein